MKTCDLVKIGWKVIGASIFLTFTCAQWDEEGANMTLLVLTTECVIK